MESSVVVLNECIKLFFTIRKEYKIRCSCGTLPSYFYSMGDYIEHWINHHKPKLSWFSSSSKNRRTSTENVDYCSSPENHPALIFEPKSRSFHLQCNGCEERNTFDSVEHFILHFLEKHREEGAQNIDKPIVVEGTSKEEIPSENMLVDISEAEQDISGMDCSDPVESVEPIEQSNNEVFPQQIDSLELADEIETSKAISLEHLSHYAEILNVGQADLIEECQEVDNRIELERLTNRNVEMDIESPPIDNGDIVEQTLFGENSVETRDEINLEAKSTAQDWLFGNKTNIDTAMSSRVLECNIGKNIFGGTVALDNRIELERLTNRNVEMDIESPPNDNGDIVEQTLFGENSVENRDEINLEAKSTAQDLLFGNKTNIDTAMSRVLECNIGKNIFGATVVLEKLEVNPSTNENINEKNLLSNEEVPGTIPNSLPNEIENAPNEPSSSLELAPTSNAIESASSTSLNDSIRSRPHPSSRKRKSRGEPEFDGDYAQGNFRRPRKMSRSSQDPISCPICSKFFSQMQSYRFHMKKFHPPTLCTICNKDFENTIGIMQHLNTHSNEVNCPICHDGNLWRSKLHLKRHFHFLNCRKCDFFTADEIALKTHQMICGQFRCDSCDAIFGDARAFRQHAFTYHENDEPFECAHCLQKFKFLNAMRTHQRTCQHAENN